MMIRTTGFILATLTLSGCQTVYETPAVQVGEARIFNASGADSGTARLYQRGDELTVNVSLQGIPSGTHAVHLHMTGVCTAPGFTSAGGHLNPAGHQHGSLNPQGAHLGDLPNANVAVDGTGSVSATLAGPSNEVLTQIFDADGTAIVVHEAADDYRTDPTGDAGGRIACGVFSRN